MSSAAAPAPTPTPPATGNYQVFARKYRPQTFDDVVGQEHITRTLKNAIAQNRLAHAYLFVGPRGIGKTSTARILAKALCCVHGPTPTPCGVCDPCREIANGSSLDVLEIDGASNNGVEQVRELRDNVRYVPTRGRFKVYIIDEVHMLTSAAFNALLKTLEEPPEHVKFIFATTEPQKVLPTILSRCQRFDLRRIPTQAIAAHLQKICGLEGIALAPDAAETIAVGADGGLRDAESMLDQLVAFCGESIAATDVRDIFGFTAPETVATFAGHLLSEETPGALGVLDEQNAAGKDLLRLLGDLITHLRNLLVFQVNPQSLQAEMGAGTLAALREQAKLINPDRLLGLIDAFAAAEGRMKFAPNKKLGFEIAVIKAIQTLGQASLDEVLDALSALREGDGNGDNDRGDAGTGNQGPVAPAARPRRVEPAAVAETPPGKLSFSGLKQSVAAPARPPSNVTSAPSPPPPLSPAPEPKTPEPVVAAEPPPAVPVSAPASVPDAGPLNGPKLWAELIGEIRSQRPLITAWVQSGTLLGVEADTFRVGFPSDAKMIVESLSKPNNRKFLETLLTKLAGRPATLKLETLVPGEEPTPPPPAAAHPAPTTPSPAPTANSPEVNRAPFSRNGEVTAETTSSPIAATAADPVASFKNDPLIQKALKVFEGEITNVELPSSR